MCRLFGSRSAEPANAAHELLDAPNALRRLSVEHADGWGIGWWPDGRLPTRERGVEAARRAPDFERLARATRSRALIAHVRKASVGGIHLDNSHPFAFGRWLFAHNGTVARFDGARPDLEAEIDPAFRHVAIGETDSARCFGIFLTRLEREMRPLGVSLASGSQDDVPLEAVVRALAETVHVVEAIADAPGQTPSATTFLVGDGRVMAACRRGRTLFHATRSNAEAAGVDAVGTPVARLLISSERPSGESRWEETPLDGIVGVDADMRLHRSSLADWRIGRSLPGRIGAALPLRPPAP